MQVLNDNLGLQFQVSARIRTPKSQLPLESVIIMQVEQNYFPSAPSQVQATMEFFSTGYQESTMQNWLIPNTIFYHQPGRCSFPCTQGTTVSRVTNDGAAQHGMGAAGLVDSKAGGLGHSCNRESWHCCGYTLRAWRTT